MDVDTGKHNSTVSRQGRKGPSWQSCLSGMTQLGKQEFVLESPVLAKAWQFFCWKPCSFVALESNGSTDSSRARL